MTRGLDRKGACRHSVAFCSLPVASRAVTDIELLTLRRILCLGGYSSKCEQKTANSQKREDSSEHSMLLSLILESLFTSRKRIETVAARRHQFGDYPSARKDDTNASIHIESWGER